MAEETQVQVTEQPYNQPTPGSAGVNSQVSGTPSTVSALAGATGGIEAGNFVEPEIDKELFKFKSDDTPLMQLMLRAKRIPVKSPVVRHFMIDEPKSSVSGTTAVTANNSLQFILPLAANDSRIPRPHGTLLVKDVDGYMADGKTRTPGKELMLFVVGHDKTSGNPICRAVNGPKENPDDEYCTTPDIPAGSTFILMANALYETQKKVDPNIITPQPIEIYLQKRGMNQIVSDYFDAQRKAIPFTEALIAEAQITDFKVKGNRTLYAGRKGKFRIDTEEVGVQDIYFTEGVRYQVRKELQHVGEWKYKEIIALAKMVFTGEDVPKSVIVLAGKNFLQNIQCIDYSDHPEIQITTTVNPVGWKVTNFHTIFGDLEFKHDPTLDRLRWSNSALVVAPDRLVHYQLSAEHKDSDRVEGEEATRKSMLVWDALALKGSCHVWINGEGSSIDNNVAADMTHYHYWGDTTAPADPKEGCVYILLVNCPGISDDAVAGQMWQYKDSQWIEYEGAVMAE